MSLESELNKYYQSKSFRDKAEKLVKSNKNYASGGSEKLAKQYGMEMKSYLIEEINKLESDPAKERFLKAIIVEPKFIVNTGWTIDIYFDEDEVTSNSLWWQNSEYENGAYLPTLFANGYSTSNYVYGYNNDGEWIRSLRMRQGYNFVKMAVQRFNQNHDSQIRAEYNEIYDGGSMDRGGLASLYF